MSRGLTGPHLFISCGEASGERYGVALVRALRALCPEIRLTAFGGPALEAEGVELVARADEVAVMGFSDVLAALPRILRARRVVDRYLKTADLDLVVPIDFPGFNLRLGTRARARGLPVYHLIAPQLWAWGAWRIGGLRKAVDRLGVLLPFERDYFESRGVRCDALGHPLLDDYPREGVARQSLRWRDAAADPERPLRIGLLPGSRRQEVTALAPLLRDVLSTLKTRRPDLIFQGVVSVAPGVDESWLEPLLGDVDCTLDRDPLPQLLNDVDLAVVCSGTASLEASLAGVPHALVYRTSALNFFVGKKLVSIDRVGLANLILKRDLVREFLQGDARAQPVADDLLHWLETPARRRRFHEGCDVLHERLGVPGFWKRSAATILDFLQETSNDG